jgi:hypothetical protein
VKRLQEKDGYCETSMQEKERTEETCHQFPLDDSFHVMTVSIFVVCLSIDNFLLPLILVVVVCVIFVVCTSRCWVCAIS